VVRRIRSEQMVGRDDELARLLSAGDRAREGRVNVVLVAGEAGIGKTRLVEEMTLQLPAADLVLVGHGVDLETGGLPYGVVAETLRDLVRGEGVSVVEDLLGEDGVAALAPLVPELAERTTADRMAMVSACLRLFESLARPRLVCWVVEDLQWVDEPTRDIVSLLCRTVSSAQLLVVATVRIGQTTEVDAEPAFANLMRLPNVELVTLDRLDPPQVRAQLSDIVGDPLPPGAAERIVEFSDGIPLLVEELAAAGGPLDLFTVEALTGAALGRLGTEARRLVEAAALGEGHSDGRLVERVLAVPPAVFDEALREAVVGGVLEESSLRGEIRFRHALIRRAVEDSILPGARRGWHQRWADALEAHTRGLGDDPLQISAAHHRLRGNGDADCFDSVVAGVRAARRLGSAAEEFALLRPLLKMWDDVIDAPSRAGFTRHDALCDMVDACIASTDMPTAAQLVDEEFAAAPSDDVVGRTWFELQLLNARAWRTPLGRSGLPAEEIARHAAVLRVAPTEHMVVDALVILAGRTLHDESLSKKLFGEARRRALELGSQDLELYSWATAARRQTALGRPAEAVRIYNEALSHAWELPGSKLWLLDGSLVWNLAVQGRYSEADAAARRAMARVDDPRVATGLWEHLVENVAWLWTQTGQWDAAEQLLVRTRPMWDDRLHHVDLRADLLELMRTGEVDRAQTWKDSLTNNPRTQLNELDRRYLLARLAAAQGDLPGARAQYRHLWAVPDPGLVSDRLWEPVLYAVRAEADAPIDGRGDDTDAERHMTQVLEVASGLRSFGAWGDAIQAELAAQMARFRGAESAAPFEAVLEAWESLGQPYDAALSRLRVAERLVVIGDRATAGKHLEEAHLTAIQLGAQPLLSQLDHLSHRAGIRLEGQPRRRQNVFTIREQEVLQHLAVGRTNAQIGADLFMSPKTVSVHVSHIMRKLGAANRTEAAAIARSEGLIEQ
jgi:DNA-binding CsgD family transcriptional regulator